MTRRGVSRRTILLGMVVAAMVQISMATAGAAETGSAAPAKPEPKFNKAAAFDVSMPLTELTKAPTAQHDPPPAGPLGSDLFERGGGSAGTGGGSGLRRVRRRGLPPYPARRRTSRD